jgi:2-polyprenyl-3-methyl-5-hydroxy-6-metoxy-1,4-benzoquinol methylase
MSSIASRLFTWLQGAKFYMQLHQEAIQYFSSMEKGLWLDLGCGPGILSRLAQKQGHTVLGVDYSQAMIKTAKTIAKQEKVQSKFIVGNLFNPQSIPKAFHESSVVSGSSLLAVLSEKVQALKMMTNYIHPKGKLLLIEPNPNFLPRNVSKIIKEKSLPNHRLNALRLWSRARSGNTIHPEFFYDFARSNNKSIKRIPLLYGMVDAWILESN